MLPQEPPCGKKACTVGLDIDGLFLAAAVRSTAASIGAASTDLEPGVMTDGEVTDAAALSEALKEMFEATTCRSACAWASPTSRSWSASSRCR